MKNNGISEDRKKYLRKIRINKLSILITQLLIVVGFLSLWEMLANFKKI